jgi:hypothetical protein
MLRQRADSSTLNQGSDSRQTEICQLSFQNAVLF